MLYLVNIVDFSLFHGFQHSKLAQIEPFKNCGHRNWHDMALTTLIIGNSIDYDSLLEFERAKCVISVNIVEFIFFLCISSSKLVQYDINARQTLIFLKIQKKRFFRQIYIKRDAKNHEPANSIFLACIAHSYSYKKSVCVLIKKNLICGTNI